MKTLFTLILGLISLQGFNQSLEVRFQPDSVVYLYETNGVGSARALYTGMVQNLAIVNRTTETVIIEKATLRLLAAGSEILTKEISHKTMISSAAQFQALEKMGVLDLYDFQLQTRQYLKGISLSGNDTLRPGCALVVTHQVFLTDEVPDALEVKFYGRTTGKKEVTATGKLKVSNYLSKNEYIFPMKGRWIAVGAPSLVSHHRWASIQEFAFDLIQMGNDNLTHRDKGLKLTDYYAYGKPIYAIGDGTVVSVLNTQDESEDLLKKPEEDETEYLQRVQLNQQNLLMKGFKYILGNHVIIKHAHGEYSFYVHMKQGSINLKEGDKVKQGDEIGALGNSGNSTEPHLHFHVANSPNFVESRSLPIRFKNIKLFPDDNGKITHLHAGQVVVSK